MISSYYQIDKNAIIMQLKVIPNSAKNEICGIINDANGKEYLKIKLTTVAEDGKANKALLKLLSKTFNIPGSSIEIILGKTARIKKIMVIDATSISIAQLEKLK